MSYSSQAGWVALKTQAVKGTWLDPGAVAPNQGVFLRTKSGSMSGTRDLMVPDPEIGGNRDISDALLGPIKFTGTFDFYARMEALATLMKGVLGSAADSGSASLGYTHTINTANSLPWLSMEENVAGGYMIFKYTDVKVNTLHLEVDAAGYLMGTMGLIGLTQATTAGTSAGNQRWDTSPLLVGPQVTVTYNAVSLPAKTFSMDINNNIEDSDFRLGSLFLGDAQEKRREITLGIGVRPQDSSLWKQAVWGTSGATAPGGITTKQQVVVTITSYEDIPGANAGVKYVTTITIPKAVIKPVEVSPSGDDVLEHDFEIQALRPVPGTDIVTATVVNSYATVA